MNKAAMLTFFGLIFMWLGAAAVLGFIVAPTVFTTEPSKTVAGGIFGNVLKKFSYFEISIVVISFAAWGYLYANDREHTSIIAAVFLAFVGAIVLADVLMLSPAIWQLRGQIGNFDVEPADAAAKGLRDKFKSMHALSSILMLAKIAAGICAIIFQVRRVR